MNDRMDTPNTPQAAETDKAVEEQKTLTNDEYAALVAKKKKNKLVNRVCNIVIIAAAALFLVSAVMLIRAQIEYSHNDKVIREQREEYQPEVKPYNPDNIPSSFADISSDVSSEEPSEPVSGDASSGTASEEPQTSEKPSEKTSDKTSEKERPYLEAENESLQRLHKKYPDVVGWLILDNTNINNVYVKSKDNKDYVRSDLNGKHLTAGTLFLDMFSCTDFSKFNTLIYGHNMRNGTMFGDLDKFETYKYFKNHPSGTICLPGATYHLDPFCFLVVKATDPIIYNCNIETVEEQQAFINYAKTNARCWRDVGVKPGDKIVTLSTCSYEFDGARCILLCRAVRY